MKKKRFVCLYIWSRVLIIMTTGIYNKQPPVYSNPTDGQSSLCQRMWSVFCQYEVEVEEHELCMCFIHWDVRVCHYDLEHEHYACVFCSHGNVRSQVYFFFKKVKSQANISSIWPLLCSFQRCRSRSIGSQDSSFQQILGLKQ